MARFRDRPLILTALVVAGMSFFSGFSQVAEEVHRNLVEEADALRKGQETIRKDLQAIMNLLRQGRKDTSPNKPVQPFVEFDLDISGHPFRGSREASLVLVEFTDYQCPVCGRHFRDMVPSFLDEFVETGKVRYVVMHFASPLHRHAFGAASAAKCAFEQERFWEMHERLFQHPTQLSPAQLDGHAEAIGLDLVNFHACMGDERFAREIQEDMEAFRKTKGIGTPSFALGWSDPDTPDMVRVVKTFTGVGSYPGLRRKVQTVLSEGNPSQVR